MFGGTHVSGPKTPEGKVKMTVHTFLDGFKPKVWHLNVIAGMMSYIGLPDIIGVANGLLFAIEVKATAKSRLTLSQKLVGAEIRLAGGKFYRVDIDNFAEWCPQFCQDMGLKCP